MPLRLAGVAKNAARLQRLLAENAAAIDRRDTWKALSAPIAVRLIVLIAARLRTMQLAGVPDRRVDLGFSTVSAWSKREKPGFAHCEGGRRPRSWRGRTRRSPTTGRGGRSPAAGGR